MAKLKSVGIQQRKQESISQGQEAQELTAVLPLVKPRAFKGELGFIAAEGHLDLPAAGVTGDDPPGLFEVLSRLIGQEVPGFFAGAAAGDHQPKRLLIQPNRNGGHPDFDLAASPKIGQLSMAPRTNAPGKVRRFMRHLLSIVKQVTSWPTYNKTHPLLNSLSQPEVTGKATIPGMHDPFAPALVRLAQQLPFHRTLMAGLRSLPLIGV
jgi:hypothetical protein